MLSVAIYDRRLQWRAPLHQPAIMLKSPFQLPAIMLSFAQSAITDYIQMGHAASPNGNQVNLCKAPLHRPAIMLTCIPSTITDCNIILPHNSPSDAPEPEPLPSATYTNNWPHPSKENPEVLLCSGSLTVASCIATFHRWIRGTIPQVWLWQQLPNQWAWQGQFTTDMSLVIYPTRVILQSVKIMDEMTEEGMNMK